MLVLQPKQQVGEFEIVRLLGKGGMGQVYEARQLSPPRPVALKVLAPWLADDEDALERFWREAAVPAQLDHPAIVRIISTGKTAEGIAYYVMQLVRGISLADLVRLCQGPQTNPHDVPTTPDEAAQAGKPAVMPAGQAPPAVLAEYRGDRFRFTARFGAVAARALAHAHQQGYLHRDIKPSNLMIDHHSQLYMVDFGLTRALDPDATSTRTGQIRGTPWYMSPEQARGETVDERSDIYSLGVTLYELITTGEGPFSASRKNSEEVLAQVRKGMVLPLQTLAPDVPPKLEQVILRAMDFRAERRYRSAAALAEDLEDAAHQSGSTRTRTKPRRTGPRWFANRHWLRAAALLVLALLGAAFIRFGSDPDVPGSPPDGKGHIAEPPKEPATAAGLEEIFKRDRPFGVHTQLMREDFQPVREHVLWGKGEYRPTPGSGLVLNSPPADNNPLVIALDYLPRASFEFSIEFRQTTHSITPNQNDLGVVFGWRGQVSDPQAILGHFTVQLDERPVPGCPHGRVTIGTGQQLKREGARGGIAQWLTPLPQGRGMLRLDKARKDGWRELRVRAERNKIKVTADGGPSEEFEMDWLLDAAPRLKTVVLEPRGAIAIWVRNGIGSFRKADIMPLGE